MARNVRASSKTEERQQKTLEKNESEIIKLMNIGSVIPPLQRRGILNYNEIEDIGNKKNKESKVKCLIAKLSVSRQGEHALTALIEVLRESGTENHKKLADLLQLQRNPAWAATLKDHATRIKNLEDVTRARDQAEQLNKQLESKEAELEQAKANANELKEENVKLNKRIDDLEVEVKDLREKKDKAEKELKDMREQMAEMEEKHNDLQEKNENLEKKHDNLEEKHDMLQQAQQETTEKMNELMMRMDKADNKGRNSTPVRVLPPIVPRNRFENGPVQSRGGARKPEGGRGRGAGATNPRR